MSESDEMRDYFEEGRKVAEVWSREGPMIPPALVQRCAALIDERYGHVLKPDEITCIVKAVLSESHPAIEAAAYERNQDNLRQALRSALAWGMTYGSVIPGHQWAEMRDEQVEMHVRALKTSGSETSGEST